MAVQEFPQLKRVSISGQISLGKEFAGQVVSVEQCEPGTWVVKVGQFIPDSERWLWAADVQAQLAQAEAYVAEHPASETNLDVLEQSAIAP